LLTLKAARLLQTCPVVAFPAGRQQAPGLAQRIVSDWLRPTQIQVPLYFPYVQEPAVLTAAWESAAATVWNYLAQGQDVVFATEGDASFYSTFTYLAQTLQQQSPDVVIETVPGVCSPLAAAALLGEPLTILNQRLTVLPALYRVADLDAVLEDSDIVVLMKVASVYTDVWFLLQRRHLLSQSRVVVKATQPDQQIYPSLENYPHLDLPYFSLLIIYNRPPIR
jgi:precorrin-2/cobalt-factor-2 C20-methyltransferase